MEIVFIGVVIMAALKLFSSLRGRSKGDQEQRPERREDFDFDTRQDESGTEEEDPWKQAREQSLQRARQTWDALGSDSTGDSRGRAESSAEPPPPDVKLPDDFDYGDFISGAKAMYSRIKESWRRRDLDDIAQFASERAVEELRRRADSEPREGKVDILLVDARLVDYEPGGGTERAQVFYDVLLRRGASGSSEKVREVWDFIRGEETDGSWKLDSVRMVQ
jgi:predicted lipid-binding transport protein (Tim44 family)